jgi:hypothetical protein
LYQEALDHHCEINTVIFRTEEPDRAKAPTTVLKELCIVASMILVGRIKGHIGPVVVF